ncbi:transaldolase [Rhodocyclus gracilis]|uniref:Transaldolase n=1 Tax=Rhodocyclus tenuis TaxID=1066 RepID=A0A6L5JV38_RHOTE|nr:transaldolase [Rhodocyclus gracilis]MQY50936.1 transaldolase [Rhodocyclus gracilis]
MTDHLASLKRFSTIVADTGDLLSIARLRPQDATTNPSLLLKAARDPHTQSLVSASLARSRARGDVAGAIEQLAVDIGGEILKLVPGRVSTEVDPRASFDTEATVRRGLSLIDRYAAAGIGRERVLIKVASTWEGIRAAERLEREGVHCNLTLLFSFAQAAACADAGVTLISPFVGRIYDWYCKAKGVADIAPDEDPGVASVARIYRYYKRHGYATEVMGASFRKIEQIERLAGCDLMTISPELLDALAARSGELTRQLSPDDGSADERLALDEAGYRWRHNEDAMAVEKLADGIRRFDADARALERELALLPAA